MKNSLIIKPMGLCAVAVAVGVLTACGGGGGPPAAGVASVTAAAESGQSAASTVAAAPDTPSVVASDPSVLDTRPASEQLAESLSLMREGQVMASALQTGDSASTAPEATTTSELSPGDSSGEAVTAVDDSGSAGMTIKSVSTVHYVKLTEENHIFSIAGTAVIRYGDPATNRWTTKTIIGHGECTNWFFGSDPAVGIKKTCQGPSTVSPSIVTATTLTRPAGLMPAVDLSRVLTAWVGASNVRISPTTEIAPAADIGAFRTVCTIAKISFDDPIVYPGQPGKSHLHTFFGNNGVNAHSTPESLRTTGESTCRAGIGNRSAYWVPSIIDTRTGVPVVPDAVGVYYKSGYTVPVSKLNVLPMGLRMIAGSAAATGPHGSETGFQCQGGPHNENDHHAQTIGNCDVGAQLIQWVNFPQCWDGVNLDSPDHKSHMAYPAQFTCPRDHPIAIPIITFNVAYTITEKDQPLHWRLSSDNYDKAVPGGYSAHGDWFNGWDPAVSNEWGMNCVKASRDCHSHLLGDGRMMY